MRQAILTLLYLCRFALYSVWFWYQPAALEAISVYSISGRPPHIREHIPGYPRLPDMFGDKGDDELYSGEGEDAMEGEEGTDVHYGGENNDFIDAANDDVGDAPDLVDCGRGRDTSTPGRSSSREPFAYPPCGISMQHHNM
jgi:hypothetical protein